MLTHFYIHIGNVTLPMRALHIRGQCYIYGGNVTYTGDVNTYRDNITYAGDVTYWDDATYATFMIALK